MRQALIAEIRSRLEALGVPARTGADTDLVVAQEFLDAGWSTGNKKISYEASIFVNEGEQTVFMFEKTTEVGGGFSFGGSSDSFTQSGKTLMRKVKIVQYGPEGKVYEVNLDLGAIPKAVKAAAQEKGYRFKTVIMQKKAKYPPGFVPPAAPPEAETAPPVQEAASVQPSEEVQTPAPAPAAAAPAPQPASAPAAAAPVQEQGMPSGEPAGKKKLPIPLLVLGGLTILWNLLLGVTLPGWILTLGILGGAWFLTEKKDAGKKGRKFLILGAAAFLILIFSVLNTGSAGTESEKEKAGEDAIAAGKTLQKFQLDVPAPWTYETGDEGRNAVYNKIDGGLYSTAFISLNSDMDDSFYDEDEASYKEYLGDLGQVGDSLEVKVKKVAGYQALEIQARDEATDVDYYILFLNVPGDTDVSFMLGSAGELSQEDISEWLGYLDAMELTYE